MAACGTTASPPPAPSHAVTADVHDLDAPALIAALAFDAAGRPLVIGSADGQSFALARYDGGAWQSAPLTGDKGLAFVSGPGSPAPAAVVADNDSFDVWMLTDDASFTWTRTMVPQPPCSGSWRIVGEDATGQFYALVDGGSLVLFTWHVGDKDWVEIDGSSEPGFEQGALVTPSGVVFLSYSPPATEAFAYQRIDDGAPQMLVPCPGEPTTAIPDIGAVDAASDVVFEACELSAMYVIPTGGGCYRKIADVPPNVCGLAGVAPDGTAFIYPTEPGDGTILRLMPGATVWDDITGDGVDGQSEFVARDATTLFRFGGIRPGVAEADL